MATPWIAQVGPFAAAAANNIALSQSPAAGAILLNGTLVSGGVATLDKPRRLIFTSGSSDTGIFFTITGTDRTGNPIQETMQGGATTAITTQDFKTVSAVTHTGSVAGTLTIGTTAATTVANSPWFVTNWHVNPIEPGIAVLVSGTVNWTVEVTMEDPARPVGYPPTGVFNPDNPKTVFPTPFDAPTALAAKTANAIDYAGDIHSVAAIRLKLNSYSTTGYATIVILQPGLGFGGP